MHLNVTLSPGTRLGPYEVVSLLGRGGMGEVYRARDTKLPRDVAIKVLSESVATDPEWLARFQREAQVLAYLNHPNIAHIHGYEDSSGIPGLVMELVEGPTLADRIAHGPIPVSVALPIAKQIAEALDAAHEHGIIHRDVKPTNIKVSDDGTVKVLDFGLAKLVDPISGAQDPNVTDSPTIAVPGMTGVGMILGTAAYMAPEQARGSAVDRRVDVWAFGCVLYEMLTGARVFRGDHASDVLAAVLRAEPAWDALPAATPASIRRVLRRALVKDRRDRLADFSSIRFDIADALAGTTGEPDAMTRSVTGNRRRAAMIWAAACALTALAAITGYTWRRPPVDRAMHFSMLPPEGTVFVSPAVGGAPALSPDGRRIAFVAEGMSGRQLWMRSVDAFDARPLPGTEAATGPFWSPDGRRLAFVANGTLKQVGLTGELPQALGPAGVSAFGPFRGAWTNDDRILFLNTSNTLSGISASGGEATLVTTRNVTLFDENHWSPTLLPDGRHYLLVVRGGAELELQLEVGTIGSNERKTLLKGVSNAQYAPRPGGKGGDLLFVRNGTLLAQRFDADRVELAGSAVTVAEDVAVAGGGALADFSVSPSGVLAYRRQQPARQELVWYDRSGSQVAAIGDRPGNSRNNVRLSPDGNAVAFTRQGDTGQDVWIADLASGAASRFTLNGGRTPVWSPDGGTIAFVRQDTIYRKPVRGAGDEVAIWSGPGLLSVNDWSGDGRYLLITRWNSQEGLDGRGVWLVADPLNASASHEPTLLERRGLHPQFVPPAGRPRWVSFDRGDVFVRAMPGEVPATWQLSTDGGNGSRWRRDGRELYFTSGRYGTLAVVDVDPEHDFQHGPVRPLFALPRSIALAVGQYGPGYDVDADGRRFLTTFAAPDEPSPAIDIVLNWRSALSR